MPEALLPVILLAMTLGIATICAALVVRGCLATGRWPSHAIALSVFFAIMVAETAGALTQAMPQARPLGWLQDVTLLLVPSLGACIWLYVRGLTSQDPRLGRRDLWHAAPVLICVLCTMPYRALPAEQRAAILAPGADLTDPALLVPILFMLLAWITWVAMLALYGAAALLRLVRHHRRVRDLYSDVAGVSLTWLRNLIVLVLIGTGLVLAAALRPVTPDTQPFAPHVVPLFYLCIVFAIGVHGVLQDSAIPRWSEPDPAKSPQTGTPYARSALQAADMARIARKLDMAMQGSSLWQTPDLALIDLSTATGVSQNNISQTLNAHLGMNFYDYVNRWRIQAACDALRTSDLSIVAISEEVGFNAKSTFNAAFKKVTGQTPRQYRAGAAPATVSAK